MGRTIIQPIGPLYGEDVNGTVFGRPNGSIYVPSTNTITVTGATGKIKNFTQGGNKRVRFIDDDGNAVSFHLVAQSQDMSSYENTVLATDSDLTSIVATATGPAGAFNATAQNIIGNYELIPGNTYYVAFRLMNNGVVVASTEVYEVVAE